MTLCGASCGNRLCLGNPRIHKQNSSHPEKWLVFLTYAPMAICECECFYWYGTQKDVSLGFVVTFETARLTGQMKMSTEDAKSYSIPHKICTWLVMLLQYDAPKWCMFTFLLSDTLMALGELYESWFWWSDTKEYNAIDLCETAIIQQRAMSAHYSFYILHFKLLWMTLFVLFVDGNIYVNVPYVF